MTKPPLPENPFTDFPNDVAGALDLSLPAMILMNGAIIFTYLVLAALIRRKPLGTVGKPAGIDLAFATAIAVPLAGLIVLGSRSLFGGLIVSGIAFVIGIFFWGRSSGLRTRDPRPGNAGVR
ncbi:hypothetical protein [Paenarthrobacter ureafaciens]|uniref:hypothetical protein n=1 Tax=Paenarthrobacter ureafaciens TaxID=37931 RepID=UPI0009AD0E0B|nr:hypothetical protein [Paenarthrobacter ureafaciens]GLU61669.1 hypothetical protein Pure01_41820 [Paenarthrobacter ureafaciens]GLU65956.1 hypothetical protein Pure02_42060 [Paenarthrobacter ureafaciens]GLU69326.1 hypothetical protein Pure03_33020 [Paenarthrobacter ureafaciens]GLU73671.1 hypothetical protein Pure04_33860 [Paenarthrobacter ureafaciens]GLU78740.1 hypothetical protein Pure05_41800 [Paenarthrobacter ureafaciens]